MFVSVPTGVDRIPCATNHDSHRAAPRCARARLTRYHRHPCVSHYGSGCWPRGQPNKIYEPNTQRRTSAVSNWNCTAQLAQVSRDGGLVLALTAIVIAAATQNGGIRTHQLLSATVEYQTDALFQRSLRPFKKGPTGIGASAGGGERSSS